MNEWSIECGIISINGGSIFVHFPPSSTSFQQAISRCFSCQDRPNDPEPPPPPQAIWPPWWTIQTLFKVTNKTTQSACKIPCQPRIWLVLFLIAIQIHFITLENMWILFIQLNYEFSILTTWNEKKKCTELRTEPYNMHRFKYMYFSTLNYIFWCWSLAETVTWFHWDNSHQKITTQDFRRV